MTWQASRSSSAHIRGLAITLTQPSPCLDLRAPGKSVNIVDLAGLKMSDAAGEAFRFISKAGSECRVNLSICLARCNGARGEPLRVLCTAQQPGLHKRACLQACDVR